MKLIMRMETEFDGADEELIAIAEIDARFAQYISGLFAVQKLVNEKSELYYGDEFAFHKLVITGHGAKDPIVYYTEQLGHPDSTKEQPIEGKLVSLLTSDQWDTLNDGNAILVDNSFQPYMLNADKDPFPAEDNANDECAELEISSKYFWWTFVGTGNSGGSGDYCTESVSRQLLSQII